MPTFKVKRTASDGKSTYVTMVEASSRSEVYKIMGVDPSTDKNLPPSTAFMIRVTEKVKRACGTYSFWLLLLAVYAWDDSRHEAIDAEFSENYARYQQAKAIVDRIPYGVSVCSDGTLSYSTGAGRCSWHGGTSIRFALLQVIASKNPERAADRASSMVHFFAFVFSFFAFLYSPGIDAYCRKKFFAAT